uniref:Uncharacterized protein n=1 Tax=Sphaerodactylus townsendi TaxID=933632 RepID=A0ACB8GC35_9SAUR
MGSSSLRRQQEQSRRQGKVETREGGLACQAGPLVTAVGSGGIREVREGSLALRSGYPVAAVSSSGLEEVAQVGGRAFKSQGNIEAICSLGKQKRPYCKYQLI